MIRAFNKRPLIDNKNTCTSLDPQNVLVLCKVCLVEANSPLLSTETQGSQAEGCKSLLPVYNILEK